MANPTSDPPNVPLASPAVVAIVEGRGLATGVIGLASMDTNSCEIQLYQFRDTPEYAALSQRLDIIKQVHSNTEILIPNSMNDERSSYIIRSKFGSAINPIARENFNDKTGYECIHKLAQNPATLINQVSDKIFCLSSFAALVAYVENQSQTMFSLGALKISYKTNEEVMLIDSDSATALELLASAKGDSKKCLFGFVSNCITRGGTKQMRSLILEPPSDVSKITTRQQAVAELKVKDHLFEKLRDFLCVIQVDLERVASRIVQIPKASVDSVARLETEVDLLVYLKHVLERMDLLVEQLSYLESDAFKTLIKKLEVSNYSQILEIVKRVISDECVMTKGCVNFKTTKAFAVRKDLSQYLEVERDTYSEILQDLTVLSDAIKKKYQFDEKSFKLVYSVARGFHLQINEKVFDGPEGFIPPIEFIRIERKGQSVHCTTREMLMMCTRLQFKLGEINRMSHVFVREVLEEIRKAIGPVYMVAEVISEVDFLMALATTTIKYDLVKPTFDSEETEIMDGKHPILLAFSQELNGNVVPNDTSLSTITNFQLITGPNMAGKSVYIRQVALLQILAQIGCHVPAKSAKFVVRDRIFARIGSDDDIQTNCSTFLRELKQIKYITENITDKSLIIVDELGRGTSDEEGVGICFATAELFIASKAFTLFATHFPDLQSLSKLYYNVTSYRFKTVKATGMGGIAFTEYLHKLEERVDDVEAGDYGIDMAESAGLPPALIQEAREILFKIEKNHYKPRVANEGSTQKTRLQFKVANHIKRIAISNQTNQIQNFPQYLETIRTRAIQEVNKYK